MQGKDEILWTRMRACTLRKAALNDKIKLGATASTYEDSEEESIPLGEDAKSLQRKLRKPRAPVKMSRYGGRRILAGPNRRRPLEGCLALYTDDSTPSNAYTDSEEDVEHKFRMMAI